MAKLGDKAVGDIVKIKVNGTARDFIVVHQGNPDTSMYDSSCDGTWLLMKDIYEQKMMWNDGLATDYGNSSIHTYLNSTFLNLFDSNTKAIIKQVKIPYQNETGSVASGTNGLSTKIFLLGGNEVGWSSDNTFFPIDGACLSYFVAAANSKRIASYNGSAFWWWLRSRLTNNLSMAWSVDSGGGCDDALYNYSYGVRPALILDPLLLVDADGFVIPNNVPTITSDTASGSDLGEISAPFDFAYTVSDVESDVTTVGEYLDDVLQRSYTVTLGETNTFQAASDPALFQKILNGQHIIKIIATDSIAGDSIPYTVTFNKQVKTATITLSEPLPADDVIKAAVISITGKIPEDATLEVLVTNNANDENPVWEDMTKDIRDGVNHAFTSRTAENGFAFNFKVTVTRGASDEEGYISSIGGAFE